MTVEVQHVKRVKRNLMRGMRAAVLQRLEGRLAFSIESDDLAVDDGLFRIETSATVGYIVVRSLSFRERICTRAPSLINSAR